MGASEIQESVVLRHRSVEPQDLALICSFPQTPQELFFMFPRATFPLTEAQLEAAVAQRFESTVVLCQDEVCGFANFYEYEPGQSCSIGNVIVDPRVRGKGVGAYLIRTMAETAFVKYAVPQVKLSCFVENIPALLLYTRLGFKPVRIEERKNWDGRRTASVQMVWER